MIGTRKKNILGDLNEAQKDKKWYVLTYKWI